jgi:hypothetical protein
MGNSSDRVYWVTGHDDIATADGPGLRAFRFYYFLAALCCYRAHLAQ